VKAGFAKAGVAVAIQGQPQRSAEFWIAASGFALLAMTLRGFFNSLLILGAIAGCEGEWGDTI
jgi:hypothetical protein